MKKRIYINQVRKALKGCGSYTFCEKKDLYTVLVTSYDKSYQVYNSLRLAGFKVETIKKNPVVRKVTRY